MPQPDLLQVQAALMAEFPVRILPPSAEAPLGQLEVVFADDAQGRARPMYLALLPTPRNIYFLQYVSVLPFRVPAERAGDVARLVSHANARIPVVGFVLNEADGTLLFRGAAPWAGNEALNTDVVLAAVWVAFFSVDRLGPVLEQVAAGAIPLAAGMREVSRIIDEVSASG